MQCNQETETLNNAKASVIKTLKEEKNILIVVSPMLSCEELKAAQQLAVKTHASISGYAPHYFDESFKDELLRTHDKAPNRKAYETINISEDERQFNANLAQASLVIILENSYFEDKPTLLNGKKSFT